MQAGGVRGDRVGEGSTCLEGESVLGVSLVFDVMNTDSI